MDEVIASKWVHFTIGHKIPKCPVISFQNIPARITIEQENEQHKYYIGKYHIDTETLIVFAEGNLVKDKKTFELLCFKKSYKPKWVKLENGKLPELTNNMYLIKHNEDEDYVGRVKDDQNNVILGRISLKDGLIYYEKEGKEVSSPNCEALSFTLGRASYIPSNIKSQVNELINTLSDEDNEKDDPNHPGSRRIGHSKSHIEAEEKGYSLVGQRRKLPMQISVNTYEQTGPYEKNPNNNINNNNNQFLPRGSKSVGVSQQIDGSINNEQLNGSAQFANSQSMPTNNQLYNPNAPQPMFPYGPVQFANSQLMPSNQPYYPGQPMFQPGPVPFTNSQSIPNQPYYPNPLMFQPGAGQFTNSQSMPPQNNLYNMDPAQPMSQYGSTQFVNSQTIPSNNPPFNNMNNNNGQPGSQTQFANSQTISYNNNSNSNLKPFGYASTESPAMRNSTQASINQDIINQVNTGSKSPSNQQNNTNNQPLTHSPTFSDSLSHSQMNSIQIEAPTANKEYAKKAYVGQKHNTRNIENQTKTTNQEQTKSEDQEQTKSEIQEQSPITTSDTNQAKPQEKPSTATTIATTPELSRSKPQEIPSPNNIPSNTESQAEAPANPNAQTERERICQCTIF